MSRLLLVSALLLGLAPAPRPAQIILFRHAEKPADDSDPHLAPAGRQRAEKLVRYVTTEPGLTRYGSPVAIFATRTTKDENGQRTQETVAPLARALKLPVQTPYHGKDYAALAKLVLNTPAFAGKSVVICWNHEEISQLAQALGVKGPPGRWKGSVYDQVYLITYAGDGKATLTELVERLDP